MDFGGSRKVEAGELCRGHLPGLAGGDAGVIDGEDSVIDGDVGVDAGEQSAVTDGGRGRAVRIDSKGDAGGGALYVDGVGAAAGCDGEGFKSGVVDGYAREPDGGVGDVEGIV